MKIYKYFLLLALYTMSCEQPYVESSNSSSFSGKFKTNRDWWPNQLDLSVLRKHSSIQIQWERILVIENHLIHWTMLHLTVT